MVLSLEGLQSLAGTGEVDTVVVAMTDMQGRLQGKRLTARYFLEEVVPHTAEACNYLLAVDVEMRPMEGYAMSSWERGYGDLVMRPDLATLRLTPWRPGTALVLCDVESFDGTPVEPSPRQVLKRQVARLAEHDLVACVGTELEFIAFQDSYEKAWELGYRHLTPANQYNGDYSISAPAGTSVFSAVSATRWRVLACTSNRPRGSVTSASTRSPSVFPTHLPRATTTPFTRPERKKSPTKRA